MQTAIYILDGYPVREIPLTQSVNIIQFISHNGINLNDGVRSARGITIISGSGEHSYKLSDLYKPDSASANLNIEPNSALLVGMRSGEELTQARLWVTQRSQASVLKPDSVIAQVEPEKLEKAGDTGVVGLHENVQVQPSLSRSPYLFVGFSFLMLVIIMLFFKIKRKRKN